MRRSVYEPMHFAGAEEVRDHLGEKKMGGVGKVHVLA
jgi:hypothetical protein